jgi:putative phosphoribosyl transferase
MHPRMTTRDERLVRIPAADGALEGNLRLPETANGVVVFAHGSGSSRFSARNRFVAGVLEQAGLATLLMDLLTPGDEAVDERTRYLGFDIGLLAGRLVAAVDGLSQQPDARHLDVGLFSASTGRAGRTTSPAAHAADRWWPPELSPASLAPPESACRWVPHRNLDCPCCRDLRGRHPRQGQ